MTSIARSLALCAVAASALAVEPSLRLGPDEIVVGVDMVNQHVDQGAVRSERLTLHGEAAFRIANIGLTFDAWMALADDPSRELEVGEFTEMRLRLDYLIEIGDSLQLLPHYETSIYPAAGDSSTGDGLQRDQILDVLNPFRPEDWGDEPHWLGIDAWYMLPWEGMEVGGSFDYDLGQNTGWRGSAGARQFIQIANLDLAFYEVLNFGNKPYHDFLIGSQGSGLTTLELGARVSLPLPWEGWLVFATGEFHWWVDSDDRRAIDDPVQLVGGFGVEWRIPSF
jgi:hypothetical protein